MRCTIDFESRSCIDIKKRGASVYSEDPSTEVLCLAIYQEGLPPYILTPPMEQHAPRIARLLKEADTIEAHNLFFEASIWKNICVPRYGWPPLPAEKLRCSLAKASMHAIPRSLEQAGEALGLRQLKWKEGYGVMMRLCKPRKPKKDEDENGIYWNEDPADYDKLYKYCIQDTISEELLSKSLSDLPPKELELWELDQKINHRGIQADLDSARVMIKMISEHEEKLLARLKILTHGSVKTAKQVENMRGFLRGLGLDLPDLTAKTVKEALLREDLTVEIREILEIRRSLGRSSSAKYQSILDRASADGRVRGSMLYHGAATGRWSGSGIQPQNFPSRIPISDDPETMLRVIHLGGLELHNALYDDDPMSTAGALTRSILTAAEGNELIVCDYSMIENRGLAWLADEETELEIHRSGRDSYIATAASILHKKYEDITKQERQSPGKVACLSCGYGGSVGAVRKFGGEGLSDDEIKEQIVQPWREAHPMTVSFWYKLEEAAFRAVERPGNIFSVGRIRYRRKDKWLQCRLPSGRILYYYDPDIRMVETPWSEGEKIKESVTYMTVDSMTKKWVRTKTFGGKLSENCCQAICRDIMAEAMLRVEKAGYPVVLTVHDEIICEVPVGFGSLEEFEKLMCVVPAWAEGFPITASGWRGKRYRK